MSFFSVFGFITFLYGLKDIMIANAMSIKYVEQILSAIFLLKLSYWFEWMVKPEHCYSANLKRIVKYQNVF